MRSLTLPVLLLALILLNGCATTGVLIGNVKPVDEKSSTYGVMDLSKSNPDWKRLDAKSVDPNPVSQDPATTATEVADVSFQSKSTASIISLNSACRQGKDYENKDLKTLTNVLLLGSSGVTHRDESDVMVSGTSALQTTIQGVIDGESIKLRTVVLKRQTCVYDLVYVARPQTFETQLEDFSHFVASLRLK
jgi:hypothetical protein